MLTTEGVLGRRQRLWNALPSRFEWVLIADPRHVQYLSNFAVNPLSFSAGERAWLLLERSGKATLLGDNFTLRSRAMEPVVDDEVMIKWYDHQHSVINRDHALLTAAKQVADRLYGRVGAVEAEWLPVGAFEVLGLDHESHSVRREVGDGLPAKDPVDLGTIIRSLRRQKDADEIALLKKCMQACDAGHAFARDFVKEGRTELEIYLGVQHSALSAVGRTGLVYGDFRAATKETPKSGGLPTTYALKPGDMYILDYSVCLDGYRSDFTNTICVTEPTPEQQHLYDVVMAAQQAGEKTLQAGRPAKDVFAAVEAPIIEAGMKERFGHHAGHGIGLAHPEPPVLVRDSTDILLAGDVVTLEPGLYVPGVGGIRIEHNYLITETGYERLSQHVISLR